MYCDTPTHETVLVWSTFEGHLKLAGTHPQLSGWRASQNTITVGETSTGPHNQPAGAGLKPPPMYVRPPKRTTPYHITTWSVPQSLQLICLGSGFTPLTSYPPPEEFVCLLDVFLQEDQDTICWLTKVSAGWASNHELWKVTLDVCKGPPRPRVISSTQLCNICVGCLELLD